MDQPQPLDDSTLARSARDADDQELVRRIARSDGHALDALVLRYSQSLAEIAAFITGSPDLAQDAVQDVFIRIWDHRTRLHIQGSVIAYLARAVRNQAKNVMRHDNAQQRLKTPGSMIQEFETLSPAVESERADAETARNVAVHEALQELPPRTREVLLMRIDLEMSYAEIASVLGIARSTVDTHLYRAMKQLASRLLAWKDLMLFFFV